ncbi:MAG: beta-lactamase family protein [Deltaproteobacteria bacterium]|nr:beta-lactamase family protein [Deltaproteobacteria bacterium]
MAALSALVRARLQRAVDAGVGSAAAFALARSDGSVRTVAVGRTLRVRDRCDGPFGAQRREPAPGVPVDDTTPFDLASLTKPLCTTTLLAQAVGRGQLALDTPVGLVLAEAAQHPIGAVALRQLLGHTSGWPAWIDFFAATADVDDPGVRAARIRQLVLATPRDRAPGDGAIYSDLGFLALGWVLEAATGEALESLFARDVAAPLDARLAFAPLDNGPLGRAAATEIWPPRCCDGRPLQGVVHDDNCAALGGVGGHAGLFGSVRAVGQWAAAWLAALRGQATPLLLPVDLVRGWTGTAACPGSSWRLGFDTPTPPGSTAGDAAPPDTVGHLGFTGTSVWMSPSQDAALVLLTNRVHPTRDDRDGIRRLRCALHDEVWSALRADAPW